LYGGVVVVQQKRRMERKQAESIYSLQVFKGELTITVIVSSIWNMQIADSAFVCWCSTFPLEVAHQLNYSPYLQSVCKHLLSSHTPQPLPIPVEPSHTPLHHTSHQNQLERERMVYYYFTTITSCVMTRFT
jgi:hypothetical protein